MLLKQISVFAENKYGAMRDITGVLQDADVNIRAISIADTTDYGIVRLIVDNRKKALEAFRENGMTVKETDVVAIAVDDTPGALHKALVALAEGSVNVEYSYGFVSPVGHGATIILKCNDQEKSLSILKENNYEVLTAEALKY